LPLDLGDSFFDTGNYEQAITEYKRFLFFAANSGIECDSNAVSYAYHRIGLSYRNQKMWKPSLNALQQSIKYASNDSIQTERKIALSVVLIAMGNYSAADFKLLLIESYCKFPELKNRARFLRGIVAIYQFNWKEAQRLIKFSEDPGFSRVDSLLSEAQNLKYKSVNIAKRLSTFLPGAGQVYVGDLRNGVNALLLNGAIGFLLGYNLFNGNYPDAILVYLCLFRRYYSGNKYHAGLIAEEYNKHLNQVYRDMILQTILFSQYCRRNGQ